jgi:hypothetical protein
MAPLRSPRREAFAQAVARSPKTGKSLTACYLDAGYQTDGESAHACASRLLSSATVKGRVDEIMRPAMMKTQVTVESLLSTLEANIRAATEKGQLGVVNGAARLMAELRGLLVDKIEIGGPNAFAACEDMPAIVRTLLQDIENPREALATLDELREELVAAIADDAKLVGKSFEGP